MCSIRAEDENIKKRILSVLLLLPLLTVYSCVDASAIDQINTLDYFTGQILDIPVSFRYGVPQGNSASAFSANETIEAQDDNDLFGTGEHSSCNYTDICSDADAIGIAKILKDNQVNKSTRAEVAHFLSDTLKQYYTGAVEHRFSNYLNDLGALTTLDDLHTTISNLMLNPELLSVMSLLGNTSNAEIGKAVFLSWAKYLWTELK